MVIIQNMNSKPSEAPEVITLSLKKKGMEIFFLYPPSTLKKGEDFFTTFNSKSL